MSETKTTGSTPETKENDNLVKAPETEPQKPNRKKLIIIICAAVLAVVIAVIAVTAIVSNNSSNDADEDDEDIEYIDVQTGNFYAGVIEPQQTSDVSKDPDRTVSEVHVKVGDTVKKGDKLFEYDSNETSSKLSKAKIEYEGIQNDIAECDTRISQLTRARADAEDAQKAEYTSQIQEQENSKSQQELNLKIKQVEIDNLQKSLDNCVVTSPIDGIIKQINNSSDSSSGAFMTVLMNGSFRVKGQVDETNVRSLSQGMSVIVHSRIVKDKTWKGTISKVDTGTTADKGGNTNMDSGNSDNSATKYYFYVNLDSNDDLLLGEHVYIEIETANAEENVNAEQDEADQGEAAQNDAQSADGAQG